MRLSLLLLLTIGCTTANDGLQNGNPDGMKSGAMLDMTAVAVTPDLGGPGAACMTACDCQPGLACGRNMTCQQSMRGMIYCCESSTCPMGSFCQSSMGQFQMCGGGGGTTGGGFGGRDGGFRRDGGFGRRDLSGPNDGG
jgi:hypothetical protein